MKKTLSFIVVLTLVTLFAVPSFAATLDTLSLDNAIMKAFVNSTKLKNDRIEIEKKDILLDDMRTNIRYTPTDLSYHPGDTNLFRGYYGSEFNKRQAEKQLENDQRQLIIDVKNAYYSIIKTKSALEASKIAYEKSQVKMLQAQAKYKAGTITNAELIASEAQVATDKANRADLETKLENAYGELNKLMGVAISDRFTLTDLPKVEKQELNTEGQVGLVLSSSLEMWTAEEAAKLADKMKLFEQFYDIGDYNVDQAKNKVTDVRDLLRQQTRTLCNTIDAIYLKNEQLTQQLRQAEEGLRVTEVQWKVGMTTRDSLLAAQNAVAQAKAGQLEVATAYVNALDTLNKLTGKLQIPKF